MGNTRFSLASAFEASGRDELALWVGDFLASRGSDNATLAAGLATRPHWWLGPLRVPVSEFVRLAGPEADVTCPIEPEIWEDDVEEMEESLEEGWEPPPVLAEYRKGDLLLQDGNHRFEALARAGEKDVWALIWFDDPDELKSFSGGVRRPLIDPGRSEVQVSGKQQDEQDDDEYRPDPEPVTAVAPPAEPVTAAEREEDQDDEQDQ